MKQITLHLGIPRSGSTYFQKGVFPALEGVYATGHSSIPGPDDAFRRLVPKLILGNPLFINIEAERQRIASETDAVDCNRIVFSNEALFGTFTDTFRDHEQISSHLAQLFPDAKIFLLFRRQDTWLESAYRRIIENGASIPIDRFLNLREGYFSPARASMLGINVDVRGLDWLPFITNLKELFGSRNVLAMPFEMLRDQRNDVFDEFCNFADIPRFRDTEPNSRNASNSYLVCRFFLLFNRLAGRHPRRWPWPWKNIFTVLDTISRKKGQFIDDEKRNRILALYEEKNRKLEKLVGFHLAPFGYY